ncbi:flagellar hook assembly protein FlgD [endosymbiont of Riftia pachyptila]|uniref:Basal-body rod modification protein FlgD n=1 Tax=endosymbiont of Riftia pachyptila (vent Ph05) TaxID=1048808 RepID=G2DE79_9GAMM|nr:flagellar hook capping FlgD N-terminal domain-containing protein [endosymbiont of Riftia pachyptila]EGV51089.1 hypothetical protein Rifp1Sym_bw00240 [endosymbiont of Riftia pachyptila (vent Ph05)]
METIQSNEELFSSLGFSATPQEPVDQGLEMEDFMNLMVTELTHQDPFKPMENTELATQISQFAAVSGIDDLNKSFTGLAPASPPIRRYRPPICWGARCWCRAVPAGLAVVTP